eukprot:Hpha_TRINITY_DN159_c0_g1::TRINITY_DN159_c0_g1_i1::g.82230::m.82230
MCSWVFRKLHSMQPLPLGLPLNPVGVGVPIVKPSTLRIEDTSPRASRKGFTEGRHHAGGRGIAAGCVAGVHRLLPGMVNVMVPRCVVLLCPSLYDSCNTPCSITPPLRSNASSRPLRRELLQSGFKVPGQACLACANS